MKMSSIPIPSLYLFRFIKLLCGVCVAYGLIVTSLLLVEDRILLHPSHDEQQSKQLYMNRLLDHCDHLECISVASGAMCFQLSCDVLNNRKPSTNDDSKSIMLCHGNAGNVLEFIPLLATLFRHFHRVYLVEYRGFGCASLTQQNKSTVSTKDLVEDVNSILMTLETQNKPIHTLLGYSIGGGVVSQILEQAVIENKPFILAIQSAVILNSFASIQQLVADHIPIPGYPIYSLMQCQWNSAQALKHVLESNDNIRIFWVFTKDDRLILESHTKTIKKEISSRHDDRFKVIELPNGGHNGSIFAHLESWVSSVFPT